MSEKVYPSHLVDRMLKSATNMMTALADVSEQQQGEIAQLNKELSIAKAAAAGKISLEKVANAGVSQESASKFAAFLEARGIIPEGTHEKYASACSKDAGVALDIAMRAIKLAEPPTSQGHGVKSASAVSKREAEQDEEAALWAACVSKY